MSEEDKKPTPYRHWKLSRRITGRELERLHALMTIVLNRIDSRDVCREKLQERLKKRL